jgi:tetratricopeptide (TPR) repeat protein
VRVATGGGLLLERAVELSLCMIVRDNARTLEASLTRVRPHVDEMIVLDTGSKDDTPEIARRLGARVYHFPWCDSFSAARNESVRYARGQWIFWMDSDDIIDAVNGPKLRQLIRNVTDPSTLGFVVSVHCPGSGEAGDTGLVVVTHVKLFRNLPQLRFEQRIHEQIVPSIRRAGGTYAWSDVFVVHAGYDRSPEGQQRKLERDLQLLQLELKEEPEHPFTLLNLGMTYSDMGQYEQAADYLRRSIRASTEGETHLRKVYALLVGCYVQLGQQEAARQTCQEGLRLLPKDLELHFLEGQLLYAAGRLEEAVRAFENVLHNDEEPHFSSVDTGLKGFKSRHNLALVYQAIRDLARAEEQWRLVVEEAPGFRGGWRGLGEVLVQQGKHPEGLRVAAQLIKDGCLRSEGRILKSQVALARGDVPGARAELEQAVQEEPEDLEPLKLLCQLLFEYADPAEAERALQQLVERAPEDGSACHNLGTVQVRLGRPATAADWYWQAVQLRPNYPATYFELGNALQACGRAEKALEAWQQTVRLDPAHAGARAALERMNQRVLVGR